MSSTTSSVQHSPNRETGHPERQHRYNADTDEGYGSVTTASTTFDGRKDGAAEERSDDDDAANDLVDWPSLHEQVQTLVSRLNNWLHHPLPDRHIPVRTSHVDHAYPILQRRTSSMPLAINLAADKSNSMPRQSNVVVQFVQNNENDQLASGPQLSNTRPVIQSTDHQKQVRICR